MSDRSIFPFGSLSHTGISADRRILPDPAAYPVQIEKSQPGHIRHMKTGACRHAAKGIHSLIPVIRSVRHSSDSKTIQYNQKYSFHPVSLLSSLFRSIPQTASLHHCADNDIFRADFCFSLNNIFNPLGDNAISNGAGYIILSIPPCCGINDQSLCYFA